MTELNREGEVSVRSKQRGRGEEEEVSDRGEQKRGGRKECE